MDGNWQLTLQLPESGGVAERVVTALMRRLAQPAPGTTFASETIAIRQLLQQLPEHLTITPAQEGWLAAMVGGSGNLAQQVARQLTLLNTPVNAELHSSVGCRRGIQRIPHASSDNALLVLFHCLKARRWPRCNCWRYFASRNSSSVCGSNSRLATW